MAAGIASGRANTFLDSEYGTSYVQIHKGNPGAAGTGNISAASARVKVTWASASGGSKAMTSMASQFTNGGATETIGYITLWTAATSGTFLATVQLTASVTWYAGDKINLDSLSIALSPLAS